MPYPRPTGTLVVSPVCVAYNPPPMRFRLFSPGAAAWFAPGDDGRCTGSHVGGRSCLPDRSPFSDKGFMMRVRMKAIVGVLLAVGVTTFAQGTAPAPAPAGSA